MYTIGIHNPAKYPEVEDAEPIQSFDNYNHIIPILAKYGVKINKSTWYMDDQNRYNNIWIVMIVHVMDDYEQAINYEWEERDKKLYQELYSAIYPGQPMPTIEETMNQCQYGLNNGIYVIQYILLTLAGYEMQPIYY